jgi:protein-S-isoprenylcysteine O-methyltransferase Ste14
MKTAVQLTASSVFALVLIGLSLFWPAGTLDFWQAWVFFGVFVAVSLVYTVYVGVTNPAVLRRRMNAGPQYESRPVQKIVSSGVALSFFGLLVVSALDHRFGWSDVPIPLVVVGNVLTWVGLGIAMVGVPLALGSYWGLALVAVDAVLFATRIFDEEKALTEELTGYREYTQKVHSRLVPHVW